MAQILVTSIFRKLEHLNKQIQAYVYIENILHFKFWITTNKLVIIR